MSSLYGSDAIGGVIQIFTRNARPEGGSELSVGLGSFQTGRAQLAHSARVGEVDYSVAAGYLGSEGFSATNPGAGYFYSQNRDPYRNRNLTSKLTWHYSPDHALGLSVFDSAGATHFVSGPGSEDVTDQHLSQYALSSDDTLAPGWQSGLRIGVSRDYSNSGSYGSVETVQRQVAWQNTLRVPGGSLVAGAEYLHDQLFSDLTLYTATERSNRAVYLAYSGDFGAHGARLSLRREDNSQFGSVTTGALAYAYRIDSLARVRASYGAGFHAPSFNFLYYPPYPETPPLLTYLSNPALRPERSRNREIGIDLDFDGQRVSFGAFENRITDLIQGSTNSSTYINLPLNLSSARIRGLEASYAGQIGASRIEARAALQDPVDQTTGLRLQQRASRFGSARLTHAWSGTEFAAEWQGSGARFGAAGEDPTSRLGGYGLVNLIAIRSLTPQWRSELRWNNVTAKHYALVPGYNTPTSNLFATLTWTQQ
jgi:vitamin B12 transporter